jgi:hypothetical protein
MKTAAQIIKPLLAGGKSDVNIPLQELAELIDDLAGRLAKAEGKIAALERKVAAKA